MKIKSAKAWGIVDRNGKIFGKTYIEKDNAKYYAGFARVIRVLITEVPKKRRKK
jgi:hypothetical protein